MKVACVLYFAAVARAQLPDASPAPSPQAPAVVVSNATDVSAVSAVSEDQAELCRREYVDQKDCAAWLADQEARKAARTADEAKRKAERASEDAERKAEDEKREQERQAEDSERKAEDEKREQARKAEDEKRDQERKAEDAERKAKDEKREQERQAENQQRAEQGALNLAATGVAEEGDAAREADDQARRDARAADEAARKAARKADEAAREADEKKRAEARAADEAARKAAREADEAARKAARDVDEGQQANVTAGPGLFAAAPEGASGMASAFAFGFFASSAAVLVTYGSSGRRSAANRPLLEEATVV